MSKKSSFIDTDIIYKLGEYSKENLLRKILLSLSYNLYIHEYVITEELILKNNSKIQLDEMTSQNEIIIMKVSDLDANELIEYESTEAILAREMNVDLRKVRDRNAGEVKSMAMAFTKCFDYFISDDRGARVSAKKHLQNLDGSSLNTINLKDIMYHIKEYTDELKISRKVAKQLYLLSVSPNLTSDPDLKIKLAAIYSKMKKDFDENIWPIQ